MNRVRRKIYTRCAALVLAVLSAVTFSTTCYGQVADQEPQNHFQRELHKRVVRDQRTRKAWLRFKSKIKSKEASEVEQKRYMKLLKEASDTDQSNLTWLKKLIANHGFPSCSALGTSSADEFFLLILHADRDRKFQKQCLESMRKVDLGWPEKLLQLLEIRLRQPIPPTIKQVEIQSNQPVSPTIEVPGVSSDEEERPSEDERAKEGNEED